MGRLTDSERARLLYAKRQHGAVMELANTYWKEQEALKRAKAEKTSEHKGEEKTAGKSPARGSQGHMDFQGG
jgi:hypothetical protein